MDKTKTEVEEILGDISLNPSEPAKLNIPLPKAQMCACGRGYAEPRANGWKGKCQECKKEHKQKALGISPKKPTSRETAPIKLCKYCGEPAVISKAGKSIGLCQGCNNAKIAKMNAARQQVKATQAATVPKQPKPAKVEQAPQCEKSFTEALLNQLLQDLHEYAQSLEPGAAVSLCMARIIINGENLYKIFKKEWSL